MSLEDNGFVELLKLDSSIEISLPYTTPHNFTKKAVYPTNAKAYLRTPIAKALVLAHQEFKQQDLGLKIWDAYRPFSIQEQMWAIFPSDEFLGRPVRDGNKLVSGSSHNRGAAVDLTLIDAAGKEMEMPTGFDDFSDEAHRHYQGATPAAIKNRALLQEGLEKHGFIGLMSEWWHFTWKNAEDFALSDHPLT